MSGRYFALEGIDGSGKDSQLSILSERLARRNVTAIVLHEPSYGVHGRVIRSSPPIDADAQRTLFTLDRIDHVASKIGPTLRFVDATPGFVVLQNRSIASAAAYQPLNESDDGLLATIDAQLEIAPRPDRIFVLDLDVDVALGRIRARGEADLFEERRALIRVRERYRRLSALLPWCELVDATLPPDVLADVLIERMRA